MSPKLFHGDRQRHAAKLQNDEEHAARLPIKMGKCKSQEISDGSPARSPAALQIEPVMSPIQIRPAQGLEVKLCRMLLGNEGSTHPHYHLFVALDEGGRPLGAGSVRSGLEQEGEFWGVHLQSLPGVGDDAVAPRLLDYARTYAAGHAATMLQTLRWLEQDSAEQARWASLGFSPHQFRYAHEIDASRGYERLGPLVQQVRDHGWIPDNARIISLEEADVQKVMELHLEHLGGSTKQLLPMLDGTAPHPYDRQASVALMCGEQMMGFTLGWFPDPTLCEVAANVLRPQVRLGWADMFLKYAAFERVTARGVKRFRFCTAEKHTDTRRSFDWVGGGTTRVEGRMQTPCRPAPARAAR
jgi:hypothetical protein